MKRYDFKATSQAWYNGLVIPGAIFSNTSGLKQINKKKRIRYLCNTFYFTCSSGPIWDRKWTFLLSDVRALTKNNGNPGAQTDCWYYNKLLINI